MSKRKSNQQGSAKAVLLTVTAAIILVGGLLYVGSRPNAEYVPPSTITGGIGNTATCRLNETKASDIIRLSNDERTAQGLQPLVMNTQLNQAATLKAADMTANHYWAHVSPKGVQPWHWFKEAGYTYKYAGENLAQNFATSDGVVTGWMNSPAHRANVIGPNYTEIGVAVICGEVEKGKGETTLVVGMYGTAQ